MKKKVAMCLCVGMMLGVMSNSMVSAEENVKLTFWKSPHSDHEEEIWASVIEEFNKEYPNIEVEFLNVAWDSVVEKTTAAFAAGSGPDISFQTEQFPLYAKNGYMLSLNDYASEEKLANYPESALEYCSYDGQQMGIPFIALNSVMFYNKDMFAEAGIENVPTNWDELLETSKKLTQDTDGDGENDQWGLMFDLEESWQPFSFVMQAGAELWNENLTNIGFNTEEGIEGLSFLDKLYNEEHVVLPVEKYTNGDEERSYFYNGKVAMFPYQIHYVNVIKSSSDINLGAFALPSGPAENPEYANWNFANIGMLAISSQTKHPDEAWKFVEFVTRPEIEKTYLSEVGFFSPQVATNELMYEGDEIMAVAAESIKNLQVSPASDYANALIQNMKLMNESIARNAATPADAIQTMENTMKAISGE